MENVNGIWSIVAQGGATGVLFLVNMYFYLELKSEKKHSRDLEKDIRDISTDVVKQLTLSEVNENNNSQKNSTEHLRLGELLNTIIGILNK